MCRDARLVSSRSASVPVTGLLRQDRSTTDAQIVRPYRATYQCTASRSFGDGRTSRASRQIVTRFVRPPIFTARYASAAGVEVCTA